MADSTRLILTEKGIRKVLSSEEIIKCNSVKLISEMTQTWWNGVQCREHRQIMLRDDLEELDQAIQELIELSFQDINFLRCYCLDSLRFPFEVALRNFKEEYGPFLTVVGMKTVEDKIRLTHEWAAKKKTNGRMD